MPVTPPAYGVAEAGRPGPAQYGELSAVHFIEGQEVKKGRSSSRSIRVVPGGAVAGASRAGARHGHGDQRASQRAYDDLYKRS